MSLIGQRLGQYEVLSFLGEGGMAAVYRARQLNIDREVAIKVIKPGLIGQDQMTDFVRRFEREARTIATLDHPHILKLFDYGQHEGMLYLVMPLLVGGNLGDLIRKGPLPTAQAARLLEQVAGALDYAHELGIIHRALKPANFLLDGRGNAI
jgi:serine/threonine-protein kinase